MIFKISLLSQTNMSSDVKVVYSYIVWKESSYHRCQRSDWYPSRQVHLQRGWPRGIGHRLRRERAEGGVPLQVHEP